MRHPAPARTGDHPRERSRTRAWGLQVLYRWETSGGRETVREALSTVLSTRKVAPHRVAYLDRLLGALETHLDEVDAAVQESLENWRLERLSIMDRSILRLAATELLFFEDVPPKVCIQEGIRLAEAYGGHDSPRFVNGVLDALFRRSRTLD